MISLFVAACVAAVVATAAVRHRASNGGDGARELRGGDDRGGRGSGALGEAGGPITFKVYLCGLDPQVWSEHVPWEVCRVKLVGCPTNNVAVPDCEHW